MLPAQRLGQLSADLAELDRELAELKTIHETRLAHWIAAGSSGERPQPSMRIAAAEHRRRLLASDAAAVDGILRPEAELAHRRAAEAVRERQIERDAAVAAAAVDAAALYAQRRWISELQAAMESQAILSGLADTLRARGAEGAAAQIVELITTTRRNVTTPQNPGPGRELLGLLVNDARALLEPT